MTSFQGIDDYQLSQCFRQMEYQQHVQQISDIVNSAQAHKDIQKKQFSESKIGGHGISQSGQNKSFGEIQRERQIEQNNILLLEQLFDIKQGKQYFLKDLSNPGENTTPQSKSLNQIQRRKQAMRINQENQSMAQRILKPKPTINHHKLLKDEDLYLQLRENLKSFKEREQSLFKPKTIKLPPLIQHNSPSSMKKQIKQKHKYQTYENDASYDFLLSQQNRINNLKDKLNRSSIDLYQDKISFYDQYRQRNNTSLHDFTDNDNNNKKQFITLMGDDQLSKNDYLYIPNQNSLTNVSYLQEEHQ